MELDTWGSIDEQNEVPCTGEAQLLTKQSTATGVQGRETWVKVLFQPT